MMNKIKKLAELIETQQIERYKNGYPNIPDAIVQQNCQTFIRPGKKYIKIDVGSSGKYMIDTADETVYGIKAYGVIHRGHNYGNLDTINNWYWGDYTAQPINKEIV